MKLKPPEVGMLIAMRMGPAEPDLMRGVVTRVSDKFVEVNWLSASAKHLCGFVGGTENHEINTTWGRFWFPVESDPPSKPKPAPLRCARCNEPNAYAEPNMPDGSYGCYSCRTHHRYAWRER